MKNVIYGDLNSWHITVYRHRENQYPDIRFAQYCRGQVQVHIGDDITYCTAYGYHSPLTRNEAAKIKPVLVEFAKARY